MKQCQACRKSDDNVTESYNGRWFHKGKDCSRILNKTISLKKAPYDPDQSDYWHYCWNLANPTNGVVINRSTPDLLYPSGFVSPAEPLRVVEKPRLYLLTCAQIGTGVNPQVWGAIKTLAAHEGAKLLVGGAKYKNPNAYHEDEGLDPDEFDPLVRDYLYSGPDMLDENLRFMTTASVTNVNPISYALSMANCNTVVSHTTRQQDAIPTPATKQGFTAISTGAVTVPNFSLTPTGDKATWNHTYGAVFVECYMGEVICRPVTFSVEYGVAHHLLDMFYPNGNIAPATVSAMILGDLHTRNMHAKLRSATCDLLSRFQNRIMQAVVHDFIDFESQSHHNGVFEQYQLACAERGSVKAELDYSLALLQDLIPQDIPVRVVPSNHIDHLTKWLAGNRPSANDPNNLLIWHQINALYLQNLQDRAKQGGIPKTPLDLYATQFYENQGLQEFRPDFISRRIPFHVHDIDLSQHGDIAPGGGRGSAGKFAKCGHKLFCGHIHKFVIKAGYWTVGTSGPVNPSYVRGYSPMQLGHGLIYSTGARSTLPFVNNFRLGDLKL